VNVSNIDLTQNWVPNQSMQYETAPHTVASIHTPSGTSYDNSLKPLNYGNQ
jgi:hypothetical protein